MGDADNSTAHAQGIWDAAILQCTNCLIFLLPYSLPPSTCHFFPGLSMTAIYVAAQLLFLGCKMPKLLHALIT